MVLALSFNIGFFDFTPLPLQPRKPPRNGSRNATAHDGKPSKPSFFGSSLGFSASYIVDPTETAPWRVGAFGAWLAGPDGSMAGEGAKTHGMALLVCLGN